MIKLHFKIVFIALIVLIPFAYASSQTKDYAKTKLTGNLFLDSKMVVENNITRSPELNLVAPEEKAGHKSRWLGGLFSLILPGSGEFYAQDYLKAGIFFVVEAAAVTTAVIYTHKGDTQTGFFQQYANEHWSAIRYAEWTLNHLYNGNVPAYWNSNEVKASDYKDVLVYDNSGNAIGVNWGRLNQLELAIGDGYSHQLVTPGQQQYYELIGKYPQYSHGWDTSNQNDTDFHTLTPQFLWYAHQRGLANEYYTDGNTALIFVYVNHFLSTLDAIWSIDQYNNTLAMKLRMNHLNVAGQEYLIPTINLSYNF